MPPRKTAVLFLLLLFFIVTVTLYYGGLARSPPNIEHCSVPESREREYIEIIHRQSEVIARQNRNITRLKRYLQQRLSDKSTPLDVGGLVEEEQSDDRVPDLKSKSPPPPLPPPTIYMITPTYARWTQKADLTRLCQTLMHVPHLVWIVVEDSDERTELVTNFLRRRRKSLKSVHLNVRTEATRRLKEGEPVWHKNRGVEQRNKALQWIRDNAAAGLLEGGERGVVYFGDDDNTYDIEIFDQMRNTKTVSVWLVGLSGGLRFEGPTCRGGRVTGWYTMWGFERAFQLDMAGFAVNLRLLLDNPQATINPNAKRGYLETSILEQLVTLDDLEPRPDNCSKVFVWHTRTEVPNMKHEDRLIQKQRPSDPDIET